MRRQLVHDEAATSTATAAMSIRIITDNNIRALRKKSDTWKSKWIKPREGFVFINVDAGFTWKICREALGLSLQE